MILRLLLATLGGIGLGYGIAHLKYGDTNAIHTLKSDYTKLKSELESLHHEHMQLVAAQQIIKNRAKEIIAQNEDYSKIISQLNRYYYQLQDIRGVIDGLHEKLGPQDPGFEKKVEAVTSQDIIRPPEFLQSENQKKSTDTSLQR